MWLESPYEVQLKNDVQITRKFYVKLLWNISEEYNIFHPENWTIIANRILQDYTKDVYIATKYKGWDGKDGLADVQWTFAGSLLYSITVITTIGEYFLLYQDTVAPEQPWWLAGFRRQRCATQADSGLFCLQT